MIHNFIPIDDKVVSSMKSVILENKRTHLYIPSCGRRWIYWQGFRKFMSSK